jgi:uncharacterized cupin superfamily protein
LTTQTSAFTSSTEAEDYEPVDLGPIREGEPNARIHWLRSDEDGGFMTGMFRCDPAVFEYAFEADEAIHVIEGEVSVQVGDETAELGPGGIASFRKGTRSVWTVKAPLKEFFVLAA